VTVNDQGLKGPKPKLGCSAIREEEEEEVVMAKDGNSLRMCSLS
jgi:hypothetical protein